MCGKRRRRTRGQANKLSIVRALSDLIRGGIVAPTAEQVAARAGVGLRSVFRHFADMETLYREIANELVAAILQARLGESLAAAPVVTAVESHEAERPEAVIEA